MVGLSLFKIFFKTCFGGSMPTMEEPKHRNFHLIFTLFFVLIQLIRDWKLQLLRFK